MAAKSKNALNLSLGQPDFDVPEEIKKSAIAAIKAGFNKYTPSQGFFELRQRIARKLREKNKIKADAEQILVTSGVSGAILLAFASLLDPGDEVIIFDPCFVVYTQLANLFGAIPKLVDSYPDFQPDIKKVERSLSQRTKIIVVNSPNNPTGAVYPEKTLRAIAKIAKKHQLLIISDEIYEDFIYEGKHFSIGSIYEKTLTLNGFSKTYGMSGWRLGYIQGPKEIIQAMTNLQQFTFVCAPSFAQKSALKALDIDNSDYIKKRYRKKRDIICGRLRNLVDFQEPQGAFYLFLQAPYKDATSFVEKLMEQNVFVVPGKAFSQKDTHFRISYTVSDETLLKAIKIMKKFLS